MAVKVSLIRRLSKAFLAAFLGMTLCEADTLLSAGVQINLAHQRVTANLDSEGVLCLYWSAERALGELDKRLVAVRDTALSDPNLSLDEKNALGKNFDLAIRLLLASGLQRIKAFGLSSRQIEPDLFINRTFTYFPDRTGFLWNCFAKPPHEFPFVKLLPENTEGFVVVDFDLAAFWDPVSAELSRAGIPEAARWQQQVSQQVQAFTGLSLEDLLGSLGDQVGLIVTLNPKGMVQIPLGNEQFDMPEPAVALVWTVRNEKLFDRLDALFSMNPNVSKIDQPDFRLRVMKGVQEIPYLTPTLARHGNYLIISSSEELVHGMINAESGKIPGLTSSSKFQKLSSGLPEKGNGIAYVAKLLQKTLGEFQMRFSQIRGGGNPLLEAMSAKLSGLAINAASYTIGGAREDGWFTAGKCTRDVNEIVGEFVTLPAYYLAVAGIEQIKLARGTDKLSKIRKNLTELRDAKDEAISEKNLQAGQLLNRQDIEDYLPSWPASVAGEIYEVGIVGQPPFATAPVDLGNYRAGSKIEP